MNTENPFARDAYAHAAAICRERAASHRATIENSKTADKHRCETQAREAEKCAAAIEDAMRGASEPARGSFLPELTPEQEKALDERASELLAPMTVLVPPPDDNAKLRKRSGEVNIDSRLVGFLYELIRDRLPAGIVEEMVRGCKISDIQFTNGWLARYAEDLAARLEGRVE